MPEITGSKKALAALNLAKPRFVGPNEMADIYRVAFDQICDPKDWKGPVDCLVPWDSANVFIQAIEFMTGLRPQAARINHAGRDCYRLTCIGYRAGPCGDH